MFVHDVDRPDVNGVPPKMQEICDKAKEALSAPFLNISTDDNLMSSVDISGSLDPKENWTNGIFHNSRYFRFSLTPMNKKRYYDPNDEKVIVECDNKSHKLDKFRKSTASPDKCIARIQKWIDSQL